jgi:hypothetical protein
VGVCGVTLLRVHDWRIMMAVKSRKYFIRVRGIIKK